MKDRRISLKSEAGKEDLLQATSLPTGTRVSVVIPVRNEERFIEAALRSVQAQSTSGFQLEILVIDGMSEDKTCSKVAALAEDDSRIKLLPNPSRHTPAALNIGLRAAAGEYVCIMGAHASYDPDYIAVCLQELLAHDAVGCSGKIITAPADGSFQARLVAWTAGHPFASSSRSVRTQPEGFADTVPFPVMRKQALLELGGYNEQFIRNQDNDMNQRLRAMGFKLYVTARTQCRYYARPNVRSFLQYGFMNGLWNALSLQRNPASLALRHLAPLAFVTVLLICSAIALVGLAVGGNHARTLALILVAILALHLVIGAVAGIEIAWRQKVAAGLWIAPLVLAFHCAYGLGTLWGLVVPLKTPKSIRVQTLSDSSKDVV